MVWLHQVFQLGKGLFRISHLTLPLPACRHVWVCISVHPWSSKKERVCISRWQGARANQQGPLRLQEWGGAENRIKKNVPGTFKNPMGVEKLRGDSCHNLISLCRRRGRGTSGVSLRSPRQRQGAVLETKKKRNKQTLKAPCVFSCAQSARWRNERGQRTESVELRLAPSRIPYGAEITLGDSCIWYRYAGRGQVGLSEATNCWDWRENCIHKTTRYSSPPWRISVESLPRQEWVWGWRVFTLINWDMEEKRKTWQANEGVHPQVKAW